MKTTGLHLLHTIASNMKVNAGKLKYS